MTPEAERISKIIVEKGQGKCWHEFPLSGRCACEKCRESGFNPDMTSPEMFIELLKVAVEKKIEVKILWRSVYIEKSPFGNTEWQFEIRIAGRFWIIKEIDQLPLLLATEIARILEGK